MSPKIILASQSPFRKTLLRQLGIEFEALSPNIDERQMEKEFPGKIEELAEYLSCKKAESLLPEHSDAAIIGSDQVLIFEGQTLSKPETIEQVQQRLSQLQGKTHQLHTGLCLLYKGKVLRSTTVASLTMYPQNPEEIKRYAELDQPMGCAGGYKIEQGGPLLFSKIETADYHSIIGLPLLSLVSKLRECSISRL